MSDNELNFSPLQERYDYHLESRFGPPPPPGQRLLNLVHREKWLASPSRGEVEPLDRPVVDVVLHWTDTGTCTTQRECTKVVGLMQKEHMQQGRLDIQYNFLVGDDGLVFEGLGWMRASDMLTKVQGLRGSSVLVGLIGTKGKFSQLMTTSLVSLMSVGVVEGLLENDHGILTLADDIISQLVSGHKDEHYDSPY